MTMLESDLQELTANVVAGLLGGSAALTGAGATVGDGALCAGVAMSGAWNGTLVVRSSPDAVRKAAEIMLSVGLDQPAPDDLLIDFLEEIANVMARGLKAVLPGVETSLPFPLADVPVEAACVVKIDLSGAPMLVELSAERGGAARMEEGAAS